MIVQIQIVCVGNFGVMAVAGHAIKVGGRYHR
jgi:hypothetical protein